MPEAQFRALAQPIMARIDAAKTIPAKWAVRRELTLEQDMILNVAGSRLNFDLSFQYLD